MSESYVYDSGALIAIEDLRSPSRLERHRARLVRSANILVPAVVAAQVVRNPTRQARLMRALVACELVPFDARHHLPVGRLLAASGTSDVVDAFVALTAAWADAAVVTSDPADIGQLLDALGVDLAVLPP
jgi:predicted nucleic acid-binding protein